MKKRMQFIRVLMLALVAAMPLLGQARINPGDVNNDKLLDIADVSIIIKQVLGKDVEVDVPAACDVDRNGIVDVADVTRLIPMVLRGVKAYPDIVIPEGSVAYTVEGVTFYMVPVQGGTFSMSGGGPNHRVTLSDYWIGMTKVTNALWRAVMRTTPSNDVCDDGPLWMVSWEECQYFINKLNDMTGMEFHLPTDAQWEFAALGGNLSHGYNYAGSDNLTEVAWTGSEAIPPFIFDNGFYIPLEVGMKMPNELGLYDMSCILPEWIWDTGRIAYADEPAADPLIQEDGGTPYWGTVRDGINLTHRVWKRVNDQNYGMRLAL